MYSSVDYHQDLEQSSRTIERLILLAEELPLYASLFSETESGTEENPEEEKKKQLLLTLIATAREEMLLFSQFTDQAGYGRSKEGPSPLAAMPARALICQWVKHHGKLCNRLALVIAWVPVTECEADTEARKEVVIRVQLYLNRVESLLRQLFS
jgi:hypothetical protein